MGDVRHALFLQSDRTPPPRNKGKGKGKLVGKGGGKDDTWTLVAAAPLKGVPDAEQPVFSLKSRMCMAERCPHDYKRLQHREQERQEQRSLQRNRDRELTSGRGYKWDTGPTIASHCVDPEHGYQPEEFGAPDAPARASKGQRNAEERRARGQPRSQEDKKSAEQAEHRSFVHKREDKKRVKDLAKRRARDAKEATTIMRLSRTISDLPAAQTTNALVQEPPQSQTS